MHQYANNCVTLILLCKNTMSLLHIRVEVVIAELLVLSKYSCQLMDSFETDFLTQTS